MARIDFLEVINELNENGIDILQVSRDLYVSPVKRGTTWFVKSPASSDKTWSLALKPETNSFTDFANCNTGGDIIRFVAYVRETNNWQALGMLRDFYGLSSRQERSREDIRRRIYLEQQEKQKQEIRKRELKTVLVDAIECLKGMEFSYRKLFQDAESCGDDAATSWLIGELGNVAEKLNTLCAVSTRYRRLKENAGKDLPSDYPAWLLDSLRVLTKECMFEPTEEELRKFQLQATQKPGADWGCVIGW